MFENFTISKHGDVTTIKVNLTITSLKDSQVLRQILDQVIRSHQLKVIIDLTSCDFVDSTFIGAIVVASKIFSSNDGEMKLIVQNENVLKIFEYMELDRIIKITHTLEEALVNF
jgi:anti-anti-sigma factor